MSSRDFRNVKGYSNRGILLVGSFAPNGASSPAATSIEGRGVASVARTSRGLWTVTLDDTYREVWAAGACLAHTDGTLANNLQIGAFSNLASSSAVSFTIRNAGGTRVIKCVKEADDAAAADATTVYPFHLTTPADTGTVTAVQYTPDDAVTADATDYATISVARRAVADYSSAIAVASRATDTGAANNMVAFTPWALTLSGTAANLEVADNDVFTFAIAKAASGVVVPAGVLTVEISNTVDVAAATANRVHFWALFNDTTAF